MAMFPREFFLEDEDAYKEALSPESMQKHQMRTYDDGQQKFSKGSLSVGDEAPNPSVWMLRSEGADPVEVQLLSLLEDKPLLVLDFGSFS